MAAPHRRALLAPVLLGLLLALLSGCAVTKGQGPGKGFASGPTARPELRRMAGQMLLVGFRGAEPFDAAGTPLPILHKIGNLGLGGVILFDRDDQSGSPGRNIRSPEQLRRLSAALREAARKAGLPPLFIAVDQEGGRVQRLRPANGFSSTPPAAELCPNGDPAPALAAGEAIGAELHGAGLNLDLAPVCDVNVNPGNPVIGALGRSFSADPQKAAACAAAFARGLKSRGVLTAAKHFPGHGSSTTDSHLGFTDVSDTWSRAELIPFRTLIEKHLADMVMTAHVFDRRLDPEHPATLSRPIITGLLRGRLGFDGVVLTDDLQMRAIAAHYPLKEAVRLAVSAGADVLLIGNNMDYEKDAARDVLDALMELVDSGEITAGRIRESYGRIMRCKEALYAAPEDASTRPGNE